MPAVQKQFEDFHTAIKLDNDDEKATLREKRKVLIDALTANLDKDLPGFETFNQGSYAMHTGVVPLDGNYDIDVGVTHRSPPQAASRRNICTAVLRPATTTTPVQAAVEPAGRSASCTKTGSPSGT